VLLLLGVIWLVLAKPFWGSPRRARSGL